jgi:polysaccharide biosynthesis transport protein
MVDRQNREDWKRERSLLALGQAVRGEEETDASLVSLGDRTGASWREDAATRHRVARSQREARATPQPVAAAETSQFQAGSEAEARLEADKAIRGGYPQARLRDEPAGVSEAYRPRAAAYEPRYAGGEQWSSRDDADNQEWKPLIDPMKVIGGIARSKMLIVTTTILGAALGIAIALSTPKKYESSTEIVVDPRDLKLTERDLTQSVVASDATLALIENKARLLTSGNVLGKVVDDPKLDLVNDPEFNGEGSGGLSLRSLIHSLFSNNKNGAVDLARRKSLAISNLAESLSVERGGKTFVITVGATTQDPKKSADIVTTVTRVFIEASRDMQSDTAGRATDELTARLDELRKGVETAERKVEDFRATHDLVDAQGHLISDDEMLKLNEQLAIARARTLELNARAASARSLDVNSVLNGTLPEEINSNTMSELRSQYAALKQEADRAAVRLGPRHPELQALSAQLAGSRQRIAGELTRIASSLQVDLKRAVQLEQSLASRLAQLKVRSGDVNDDLVSLRELEREATAKRSVYEQYLLRAKETAEQKDIDTANISVMSPAYIPLEAKGPSRAVTALAGLLLGMAAGIGLGAMRGAYESLRETANSRSRRRPDERRLTVEDKAYQAPPPAPPVESARTERSGLFGGLFSAMGKIMPGKASAQKSADTRPAEPVSPAMVEGVYPRQGTAGYPPPDFRQDAYAAYPQQPPLPAHMMPQPPVYPAPHGQHYPYGAQPGYPPVQAGQMQPPTGSPNPQPMAPYAGQTQYRQPPAAANPAEQQTQVEEIRNSLREFREAVRELTENRSRRRYF